MRFLHTLIAVVFGLPICHAEAELSRFIKIETQTLQFLNNYPELRIVVKDGTSPVHQAAAIALIKKLRQLGFQNPIELLYGPSLKQRLEFLLPPFSKEGGDPQFIADLKVTAKTLSGRPQKPVDLTILASTLEEDRAENFQSKVLLAMAPPRWGEDPEIHIAGALWPTTIRNIPDAYPSRIKYSSPQNIREFLVQQFGHSEELAHKIDGLEALIKRHRSFRIRLLSAHGLDERGVDRFVTLLRALLNVDEHVSQPIVIGLLSSFSDEEWESIENKLRTHGLSLRGHVLDLRASDFAKELDQAPDNHFTIVRIGQVTPDVWTLLMNESSLPPTTAGANGPNFLFQRGRPFLVTERSPVFNFDAILDNPEDEDISREFLEGLRELQQALETGDVENITHFYTESLVPSSRVSSGFTVHADIISQQLADRTCATLLGAQKILEAIPSSKIRLWRSVLIWLKAWLITSSPTAVK